MYGRMPAIQAGFSLIELSVATAVYSMGLGGMALMLLLALHGTTGARLDTVAAIHAASLAETIAMTSDAAGHYLTASEAASSCEVGQSCSLEEMAAAGLTAWRRRLAEDLPQGAGLVCRDGSPDDGDATSPSCDGGGGRVIKVFWEVPAEGDEAPAPGRHVVQLPLP
jgi:type IV pilus assembly protein PilV